MIPLSSAITSVTVRPANVHSPSRGWPRDDDGSARCDLLTIVHRGRRGVPKPGQDRLRDLAQPDPERIPRDELSREPEGAKHSRNPGVSERPGDSGPR